MKKERKNSLSLILLLLTVMVVYSCRKEFVEPEVRPVVMDVNPNATPYALQIPPFFASMDIPEDNPMTEELVELGRHLFWDKHLSGDNTQACASCHLPESAFSDPNQFSIGITGAVGTRQAMACINLGYGLDFFWDGRAKSLEELVVMPVADPTEMNEDWDELLVELSELPDYPEMYGATFNDATITKERTAKALAAFLRTMISGNSKFDLERIGLYDFSDSEERGFNLFIKEGGDPDNGQGGQWGADCFHCHGFGSGLFTDNLPHNNGLDSEFTDLGYGAITGDPSDYGKFKTPTLRNVELTAPYMHDGRFNTLEEVIDHYDSGGNPSATIDPFMKYTEGGLQLSDQDKEDLIAFLKCLTDTSFISNESFLSPFE